MQQLLGKRNNRGRSMEYAALIKELLQEVEKLTLQNESLKKQLSEATSKGTETAQRVTGLIRQRETLESKLKGQQEQNANEKLMVALEMANKQSEISRLQQENMRLNDLTTEFKRDKNTDRSSHNEEIAVLRREVNGLKQALHHCEEEKQSLMREVEEKDNFHMMEVEQLRKINSIIKKNFQIMEEDYDALLKLTEQQPTTIPSYRRQQSKPKKNPSIKKIKPSVPNPQMEQQLWRIKQQVSDQMTRMTLGREQASKNRVDRTLATLQSLLTEISQRVEQSDCESGHD